MSVALARSLVDYRRRAFVQLIAQSPYADGEPLARWSDEHPLWDVFSDRPDLLSELQAHWIDLLSHAVYSAPQYPLGEDGIREVYGNLADGHPALRAILDANEAEPAIAEQVMDEHVLLARAAGNLDARASASTLAWRARDLLASVPEQRAAKHVTAW